MNRGRSLLLLVVIALALGAYIYFFEAQRDTSDPTLRKDKVFTLESDKVEELQVRAADGVTTTLKKEGGSWRIVGPEVLDADASQVSSLLTSLESMDIQRVIAEKPTTVKDFGLEPARYSVTFRTAGDSAAKTLNFGNKTPTGSDLYAQVGGDPKLFLVSAYVEDSLNRTTFDLRDKTALKFSRDAVDALTSQATGAAGYSLAKKGTDWRLVKPIDTRADGNAVESLLGRVEQARMKTVVAPSATPADMKKYGLDKPQAQLTIGAGSTQGTLAVGGKHDDTSVYARDLSRPLIFTVDAALLEELKKGADDFRVKDIFTFRTFSALGADFTLGGQTFGFAKEKAASPEQSSAAEVWKQKTPAAKDVDQTKFTDLLTTLSNLRADKFADKPLAKGDDVVVVARSGEAGAPVEERVTFRKAGDVVHAIRSAETGAAIVPTAEYDKALALLKELTGVK